VKLGAGSGRGALVEGIAVVLDLDDILVDNSRACTGRRNASVPSRPLGTEV
jgi:hypothetical protein